MPSQIALPVPPLWEEPLSAFLRAHRNVESPKSLKTYRSTLSYTARNIGVENPWDVTAADLEDWWGGHDWAQETARKYQNFTKKFYEWARRRKYVTENPVADTRHVKGAHHEPRPIPLDEYEMAYAAAPPEIRLALRIAYETGMRRSEIAAIHTRDLSYDREGYWLRVPQGKGRKPRSVPLNPGLYFALQEIPEGWIFPSQRGEHLEGESLGRKCARYLPGIWTMHTIRHRAATDLVEEFGDIQAVAAILGHANLNTTNAYAKLSRSRVQSAIRARSTLHALAG